MLSAVLSAVPEQSIPLCKPHPSILTDIEKRNYLRQTCGKVVSTSVSRTPLICNLYPPKIQGTMTLSHCHFDILLPLHALPFDCDAANDRESSHSSCDSECFDQCFIIGNDDARQILGRCFGEVTLDIGRTNLKN